jgi:hypothetical protein
MWFSPCKCNGLRRGWFPANHRAGRIWACWRSQQYGEQFFKDFLPIGSSMGASLCKDEEWRPDLYLKVAASIVPKELEARWWIFFRVSNFEQTSPDQGA